MNIKWMILIFTFCAADKHLPNGARHRWSLHLCHLELCGPQLAFTHWGRRWYHQGGGRSSSIRKSLGNPELLSVVSRSHCRFGSHLIKHFAQKEIHLHISHTHTHTHMRAANTAMFIIDGYQATAKFSLAFSLLLILIHFTFQTLVWCSNLYCKMCHPRFMLHCECSGLGCHMHGNISRIYGNFAKVSWKYTMLQSQLILTA